MGPNLQPPLVDVLLRFRLHQVALTADVSKMYRAIELAEPDRDYHRFVWRSDQSESLVDYRMTRVTFGVSASSFAATMSVRQNAKDFASKYPLAAKAIDDSTYVDDCLTGADTVEEAMELQDELQNLFNEAKFLLRKWNSSEPSVLDNIPAELQESHFSHAIPEQSAYTKTLGLEWNSKEDVFRLTVSTLSDVQSHTKRLLTSDIARTFDVLGWFSPSIIKAKILLQRVWELKITWDEEVPQEVLTVWQRWRSELQLLADKRLQRCYFPRRTQIQLHGFCDASEDAFAAVIYLRTVDLEGCTYVSLVMSKTRVAPLKRLTIPRLELCGAHLLAQILSHVQQVLNVPLNNVYAWTDSTVLLGWLAGDPRRFKPYVGNRVSQIIERLSPDKWRHVSGSDNPADCASRGLYPSELLDHKLWWQGPDWLHLSTLEWPQVPAQQHDIPEEERKLCFVVTTQKEDITWLACYSNFTRLKCVTAWVLRFIHNSRSETSQSGPLSMDELTTAETLWILKSQSHTFLDEIEALKQKKTISSTSCLLSLHPFLDSSGVLRVGGRLHYSSVAFSQSSHCKK